MFPHETDMNLLYLFRSLHQKLFKLQGCDFLYFSYSQQ